MTVRVERVFEIDAPREDVWEFIADPEKRARPISVVEDFETTGPRTAVWHVKLPIPRFNKTMAVETEEIEIDPPRFVKFVGDAKGMTVDGEHLLEEADGGTRLTNRFVVDGHIPGVETYFKRKLDGEMENIEAAIRDDLGI